MKDIVDIRAAKPQTAEDWHSRISRGSLSETEQKSFDMWIRLPKNRSAYNEVRAVSRLCEGLLLEPDLQERLLNGAQKEEVQVSDPIRQRWWRQPKIAAAAIIVVALSGMFFYSQNPQVTFVSYQTATGERERVVLDDGTVIELNTRTRLLVGYSEDERRVQLDYGEAYFQVEKEPLRPFFVESDESEVRVTGTAFNVRNKASGAEIAVTEGAVQVRRQIDSLLRKLWPADDQAVVLTPGESALVSDKGIQVGMQTNVDALTAWRTGKIHFYNDPLLKVFAELNRYSEKKFYLPDPQLQTLTLSGVFKTNDPQGVLFALKEVLGLEGVDAGNEYIVRAPSK